jgi:xanthine dehydrogenase molybdopterin-binding subunit B
MGRPPRRPPSLTPEQQKEAIKCHERGATLQELAHSYNVRPSHQFPSHKVVVQIIRLGSGFGGRVPSLSGNPVVQSLKSKRLATPNFSGVRL